MAKLPKIFSSIFISFLLIQSTVNSQNKESKNLLSRDSNPQGITLGLNLEGPIGYLFDKDKWAFSMVSHINLSSNWFFRGEAGFENLTFSDAHA